jgi:hypothetical protein
VFPGACRPIRLWGAENLITSFATMQFYREAHWDTVFVCGTKNGVEEGSLRVNEPFTEVRFCNTSDHLEVLGLLNTDPAKSDYF